MGCQSNNATPPSLAIAPGFDGSDPMRLAEAIARGSPGRWAGPIDPRIPALVPGFDAPFFQAGLAGYSDAPMRIIARRHGCPYCVTEALLDRTLLAGGRGFVKADLGELHDNVPGGLEDQPLSLQIMGSDPHEMAAAALKGIEQCARSDREYRSLAYSHMAGDPSAQFAAGFDVPIRLPGNQQLPPFDPTEGLGDEALEEITCGDDATSPDSDPDPGALAERSEGSSVEWHDSASYVPRDTRRVSPRAAGSNSTFDPSAPSFATVDVNLACPVKKIRSKARGGHWLAEPRGAIALLEAVREAVPAHIPCTVKLRRSFDDTPEMVEAFFKIYDAAYDMGYAWATVHARTVEQKYVGPSRWDLLREIVRHKPDRVVFGSGDIWTVHDIFRMIAYTGVSAVSVARGCIGNPWIFRQARMMLEGRAPLSPTIAEQREVLQQHYTLALAANRRMRHPDDFTSKTMRKFGIRFAEHHPRGEEVRLRFIAVKGIDDWHRVLEDLYAPV